MKSGCLGFAFCVTMAVVGASKAGFLDEPGCFVGAYIGSGDLESHTSPAAFNAATGKTHAAFVRYVDASTDLDNPAHWAWADTVVGAGAWPVFFLDPFGGLSPFADGTMDGALSAFGERCAALGGPAFVVLGHEMNGSWYPWGQQPPLFVAAFQRVSAVLRGVAPLVQMCWVPSQAYGYPWGGNLPDDGYAPYYPGDGSVDWVGLTHFDRDWDENNMVGPQEFAAAITYRNFYGTYAVGHDKPMLTAETGLYDANLDPSPPGPCNPLPDSLLIVEKNQWVAQVYDPTQLDTSFPNLKLICYFQVRKWELDFGTEDHSCGPLWVDWRLPLNSPCLYCQRVAEPYFRSGVSGLLPGSPEASGPSETISLQVAPNPSLGNCTVWMPDLSGPRPVLSVIDASGRQILRRPLGQVGGNGGFVLTLTSLPKGVCFLRALAGERTIRAEKVVVVP